MLYSTKVISASGNLMLNICDPELIDKTFHDKKYISQKVSIITNLTPKK